MKVQKFNEFVMLQENTEVFDKSVMIGLDELKKLIEEKSQNLGNVIMIITGFNNYRSLSDNILNIFAELNTPYKVSEFDNLSKMLDESEIDELRTKMSYDENIFVFTDFLKLPTRFIPTVISSLYDNDNNTSFIIVNRNDKQDMRTLNELKRFMYDRSEVYTVDDLD